MRAHRIQIHSQFCDIHRYLSQRLDAVGVEIDSVTAFAGLADHSGDLGDRLHNARLIVRVHHAHQHRVWPDMPLNFGHKGMWFAVKATDAQRIAAILNITQLSESNWHVGIDKAYKDAVFITPPVDGWTLVFGVAFPYNDTGDDLADVKKKLQELSKEFGEAQFFSTNRVVEFHGATFKKSVFTDIIQVGPHVAAHTGVVSQLKCKLIAGIQESDEG